ncbi:hypothetical protein B0H10DRAFT_1962770 [Mycena sp. CBHHK59/15]|nr:hypothetical protein B0H10DRAFT_1966447 [Mycena sp. CBHHK59/15]KAJ6579838.1 hypothetical protein B0H10DRAFT_1962770 [Mycena sp. CBHHK59/15]
MELTKTAQKKLLQNLQKLQSAVGPTIQLLEKSLGQDAMTKTVKLPVSKRKVPSSNANITKAPQKKTSKPASTKAARGPTKKANGQASNAKAQENERHADPSSTSYEDVPNEYLERLLEQLTGSKPKKEKKNLLLQKISSIQSQRVKDNNFQNSDLTEGETDTETESETESEGGGNEEEDTSSSAE